MNMPFFSFRRAVLVGVTMAAGIVARSAETAVPVVSLSLRGVADRTIEQGEPLSVAVRMSAPRESSQAIEITPATGAWTEAISVEIARDKSAPAVARATAVGRPDSPRATLDRSRIAGGLWLFSGSAVQGLAPGDYVVRVRLKVETGAGWKGEAMSNAFPLKVVAPSADPHRVAQRTLSRANEAMLANRNEEAAGILDALLQTSPDNRDVLVLRAVVAERAGNLPAALACVNRASRGLSPNGPPPLELQELRTRLQAKLTAPPIEGETFNPPAWSWPPASVLSGPGNPTISPSGPAVPKGPAPSRGTPVASAPAGAPPVVTPAAPANPSTRPSNAGGAGSGVVVSGSELVEAKILADSAGQWAAGAAAGSQYGRTQYSAAQATGAPNVPIVGNSPDAWCPANKDTGMDWLELTFAKPAHAVEVRVRQNDTAGAIVKVEAIEADGTAHLWWEGVDPFKAPAVREIAWFGVRVPKTPYLVARVKLTLNLASGPGYKEIDAVQLVTARDN